MSHHGPAYIRDALPTELAEVRSLLRIAYREHAVRLSGGLYEAYLADLLHIDPAATSLVGFAEGRVVATARLFVDGTMTGLDLPAGWSAVRAVAVHPDFRGTGLAEALMTECADRAARAGAPVLALHTTAFMAAAIRLYERLGYQRAPALDVNAGTHYAVPGGAEVVALGYVLELDTSRTRRIA